MAADSARLCVIWCQHLRLPSLRRRIVCAARVVQRGAHVRDKALPWVYAAKCGSCASRSPSAFFLTVFAAVWIFVLPRPCWHVSRALRGVVTPPVTLEVDFETMLPKDIADVGPIPKAVVTGLLSVVVSVRSCF